MSQLARLIISVIPLLFISVCTFASYRPTDVPRYYGDTDGFFLFIIFLAIIFVGIKLFFSKD